MSSHVVLSVVMLSIVGVLCAVTSLSARRTLWYRPLLFSFAAWFFVLASLSAVGVSLAITPFSELMSTRSLFVGFAVQICASAICVFVAVRHSFSKGSFDPLQHLVTPKEAREYKPQAANSQIDKIGWDDVVIEPSVERELRAVTTLLKDSAAASRYGIEAPKGILLYGPPGTGKTTLARIVASTAGCSFFIVRANEVISNLVGESEKNLSALFAAAQRSAPAVIFIDEIDSIGLSRSDAPAWAAGLLNHLLQLIDGVAKSSGVYIIGATNRVELVDEALKRSGRLSRLVEITLPGEESRRKILEVYLRNVKLSPSISPGDIASRTAGCSPADLRYLVHQAGLHAFQREQSVPERKRTYQVAEPDMEAALRDLLESRALAMRGAVST